MNVAVVGCLLLAGLSTSAAPISQHFRQEQREHIDWNNLDARKEEFVDELRAHLDRLGDAHQSLLDQFTRIERREHLDFAVLRIEQVLRRVQDLEKTVSAIEKAYGRLPPAPDLDRARRQERKLDCLAILTDPKDGAILEARESLVRLLCALDNERSPDIQLARDAQRALERLGPPVSRYVDEVDPVVCYRLIELMTLIELEQRNITMTLHSMGRQRLGSSRNLLPPKKH